MPALGIPQAYQADFGPTSGGTTTLAAVWTDGLPATATVTVTDPAGGTDPVTVTSEYGDATTIQAASGTAYRLPLSDQVTYLTYPAGDTLAVGPTEAYGTNLASASAGGHGHGLERHRLGRHRRPPASATGSAGRRRAGDTTPSLTVTLAGASTLDRVIVDTQSVGSTATGLRDYTLSADEPGTGWVTIATETGQYRDHEAALRLRPGGGHRPPGRRHRDRLRRLLRRGHPPVVAVDHGRGRLHPHHRGLRGLGRPRRWWRAPACPPSSARSSGGGTGAGTTTTTTTTTTDHHDHDHDDRPPTRPPPRRRDPPTDHDDDHRPDRRRRRPHDPTTDHDDRPPTTTTTTDPPTTTPTTADHHDDAPGGRAAAADPATPPAQGVLADHQDGGIFTFGDAVSLGSTGGD